VLVAEQIATIETQQRAATRAARPDSALGRLVQLKGIATTSATVLLGEGLVWRDFQNRRQIGGLLGFAPTKYDSGESTRDQGISRAGNPRLQSISIQLAWSWVRWQPLSGLTLWFHSHFGSRKRERRVGIVALARKLIIALWRYVTRGVVPAGAILKPAALAYASSSHRRRACHARGVYGLCRVRHRRPSRRRYRRSRVRIETAQSQGAARCSCELG
jgi:transposase